MTKPRLAILGGTFDPIHKAHLACALYVQDLLKPSQVQLMPCHLPPHRATPGVSSAHRAAMVQLALAPYPGLALQNLELEQQRPSYTVDSLLELKERYPSHQLFFILGSDSLAYFKSWKNWQQILELSHLLVCQRPSTNKSQGDIPSLLANFGEDVSLLTEANAPKLKEAGQIFYLDNAPLDLSATQIRNWLRQGLVAQAGEYLSQEVGTYIAQHQLYQAI